jgi:hypothetical protein
MLQVFYLDIVKKLDLDVACVCNGFQVFSGILQVFQLFRTYVTSVSSGYCKSRSGVKHVALGKVINSGGIGRNCTCNSGSGPLPLPL